MMPLLYPGDAVAALLTAPDGRYVLQRRDDKLGIFFPDFWGAFGGAIEAGETPEQALCREIREELDIAIDNYTFFCRLVLDFRYAGAGEVDRHFFVVPVSDDAIARMVVHEGIGYGLFSADELATMAKIVPYDAVVIWQHVHRDRIGGRYR